MTALSNKTLGRLSLLNSIGAGLCLLGLLIPQPVTAPQNPPADTLTILASPRSAKVYKIGARSEATPDSYLENVNQPIPLENFFPNGVVPEKSQFPTSMQIEIRKDGYQTKSFDLKSPIEVLGFFSQPIWPHRDVISLEPQNTLAVLKTWTQEKALPLGGLLLFALAAIPLSLKKSAAARRADFLESCRARAGQDSYIGTQLKEFLIVDVLGKGSFGVVYKAIPESRVGQKTADGHAVAIKVSTNLDPQAVKRFYQELDVARQAEHVNIVRIFEKGLTPDGSPFLVMELLQGRTLSSIVTRSPKDEDTEPEYLAFPPQDVVKMLEPVIDGLQYAHDHGVVHRDFNPNNIMILEDGRTKILDFGLSKMVANKGLTMTQDAGAGTPLYLPYEQIFTFAKVDARVDQFALGSMIYHMLSGGHPYGTEVGTIFANISQNLPPRPLLDVNSSLKAETAAVVERMLAHEPDQRYSTTKEAFEAFKASL